MMNLGASLGQMRVIPIGTTEGAEVHILTFGAIDIGMLTLLTFLICSEQLVSIPPLFFVYIAAMHDGGLARG